MNVGDVVEDFELPDETGQQRTLSGLLEKGPVVLFFYPAAMTKGCTAEACHFRDLAGELAEVGAHPVGISGDEVSKQKQFADTHSFGFPLLADPAGTVRERFGVKRGLALLATRRQTFVIDTDRRVLAVVKSEIRMNAHADRALEVLRGRKTTT
jgi:peroxiredoxin Q/BCP